MFETVSEFPFELRPSMVTQFVPFKLIKLSARLPEIVRAPEGNIRSATYDAPPVPFAFSTAEAVSTVSPRIQTVICPWCVPTLIASKAALRVR